MMASLKLYFRVSSVDPSRGSLIFRIIHKRRVCAISTGVKINAAEWDRAAETVVGARAAELLPKIEEVRTRIQTAIAILERAGGEYSVREIADRFYDTDSVTGVMAFIRLLIKECGEDGKQSAADHYRNLLGCISAFLGVDDVALEKVDTRFADRLENHMKKSGMCPNSTSYYMRKLRAAYNQAVERNLTPQLNPFRHVYTGVAKTEKRAVSLEVLNSLVGMELEHPSGACLARDMFLFSFYTRGMSTVDMAYLRKTDLRAGVLTYRRQKTSQSISIKWEPAMQRIVDRYADADSVYMLPLIKPGYGRRREAAVSERVASAQQESETIGREVRADHAADNVCGEAYMGEHSAGTECSAERDQPGDGARFGKDDADLSGVARQVAA